MPGSFDFLFGVALGRRPDSGKFRGCVALFSPTRAAPENAARHDRREQQRGYRLTFVT